MDVQLLTDEERKEIISYGLERGKVISISIIVTLVIGGVFNAFFQSIIFLVSFCSLRRYAGGYHADSQKRCYVISFFIVVISILLIKLIKSGNLLCIIIQTINYFVIVFMAPVENNIRKLEEAERKKYGRKTRTVASVMFLISIFLYWNGKYYFANPIGVAGLVVGCSLIFGNVKYRCRRGR